MILLDNKPVDIPLPNVEECTSGEVGSYWDNRDIEVFAEVLPSGDGAFAYFADRGAAHNIEEECGKDGEDVHSPWPGDLLQFLKFRKAD